MKYTLLPRLEDSALLASLSSSQPGILKREREEEGEELEQEGEPDSKKSNVVEKEAEKESDETHVVVEKEAVAEEVAKASPVVAATKLRDAALEASFSSSGSRCRVEEEQEEQVVVVQHTVEVVPPPLPIPTTPSKPDTAPSTPTSPVRSSPRSKETTQVIGAKELLNDRMLQRRRLNKMLTIFEDQGKVLARDQGQVARDQGKVLARLPSHDQDM